MHVLHNVCMHVSALQSVNIVHPTSQVKCGDDQEGNGDAGVQDCGCGASEGDQGR